MPSGNRAEDWISLMDNRLRTTILAGAATLAMVTAPLAFAQGNGNGNGNGNRGGGKPAASQVQGNGGGGGNAQRGNRGNGGGGEARGNSGNGGGGNAAPGNRGGGNERVGGSGNRGNGNQGNQGNQGNDNRGAGNANRGGGNGNAFRGNGNGNRGNGGSGNSGGFDLDTDFALPVLREAFGTRPRLIDGCPPGLAKKRNGCLPPGQARQRYRSYDPGFFGLFGADRGNYFYDGGYLLRYRGDGLAGYIPLLGGALGLGEVWPCYYEPQPLPNYYRDYYGLGDQRGYRYADNVIYRVEPESAAILGVAALLTGDDIRIGQPMPRGYDVYNVPYSYRDRYYDRPDRRYRYADGYVYEIDTETALVLSAIQLLD